MKYIQNGSCDHVVIYLFNEIYMTAGASRRALSPYIPNSKKDIIGNIEKMVEYYA